MIPTESTQGHHVPRVHAVVVTWNGAHLLPGCLRALRAQRADIVVVDNASTDGTAELLARDFPDVTVLRQPENLGYGRANNVALRRALQAGAEFALLVNNDVLLEPGYLAALLADAAAHPEAGLFTGTLLFAGEGARVNSTGLEIDGVGRARDRDYGVPLARLHREAGPCAGVSGGAALLRCAALREVGLFDPGYFAYYEDVDLSLRAARAGIESRYVPQAVAHHLGSASFGAGSPRQRFLLGRNHLRTLALHQPPLKAAALVPLTAAFRAFVKTPLELAGGRPDLALAELRAAASGLVAAASAVSVRVRGGIPRGAEPE